MSRKDREGFGREETEEYLEGELGKISALTSSRQPEED